MLQPRVNSRTGLWWRTLAFLVLAALALALLLVSRLLSLDIAQFRYATF